MGPALYGNAVCKTVCKRKPNLHRSPSTVERISDGTGPDVPARQRRWCRRRSASAAATKIHATRLAPGTPAAEQWHPDFGGGGGPASGGPASKAVPPSSSAPVQTSLVQTACDATSWH